MDAVQLRSQGLPEQRASGQPPRPHLLFVRPQRIEDGGSAGVAPELTDHPLPARSSWLGRLHLVSSAGLSVFVVAILALHGLRAGLNPVEHTISEYSLGSYGWLMRVAFFALGAGTLTTAASLGLSCGPSGWRRIGPLLLAGTAIGLFLDAGFNTDHLRVPETVDGSIHCVGTWIIALALPGAAFILGSDFARTSISTLKARLLPILGAAQLGAIVLFEVSPTTSRGWAERLVTVFVVATLGLMQILSRTNAHGGRPRTVAYNYRKGPVFGLSPVATGD